MNKSPLIADNLERQGVFIKHSKIHYALLGNDCSIRVYQSFVASYYAGIMQWPIMLKIMLA